MRRENFPWSQWLTQEAQKRYLICECNLEDKKAKFKGGFEGLRKPALHFTAKDHRPESFRLTQASATNCLFLAVA